MPRPCNVCCLWYSTCKGSWTRLDVSSSNHMILCTGCYMGVQWLEKNGSPHIIHNWRSVYKGTGASCTLQKRPHQPSVWRGCSKVQKLGTCFAACNADAFFVFSVLMLSTTRASTGVKARLVCCHKKDRHVALGSFGPQSPSSQRSCDQSWIWIIKLWQ